VSLVLAKLTVVKPADSSYDQPGKTWMRKGSASKIEAVLLAIGLVLLATFFIFRIHSYFASRAALRMFAAANAFVAENGKTGLREVDFSLWSEARIKAYKQSLAASTDGPIAVLTIPRLSLEVPVFEGTDEMVLNRGVGRIEGTAGPGENGNIGIAGHRDGFFRGLKNIQAGDTLELATWKGRITYVVDTTEIVQPEDVRVLQPKGQPALTLVTCYPFYFVGHAPQRYIVHASIVKQDLSGNPEPNFGVRAINQTINQMEATK
jgi:sortase A